MITLGFALVSTCQAELSAQNWPLIKEAFFQQRPINTTDLIQLTAPLGAENAGQVPVSLQVKNQEKDAIKSIYIFIDANPIPLAATYKFPKYFNQLTLSTRVRLDSDSTIHAIAETQSDALLMATTRVNAGGGCAGAVSEDEAVVRANAGAVKFQLNPPYKLHEVASATLQIKHPMYTGLQTDVKTKQTKPAFYVKNTDVKFDGLTVMQIQFGVGTAENPYVKFKFDLPTGFLIQAVQKIDITTQDNEGKSAASPFYLNN
ncbi:MAG: quinoprotein dehydrogenase-associated SoxYZ-like carrier [Methylotenera sp.]|nr:quinoprotein dehydrogenase-associated SoxYZ-like carrier [Methylotenera sp.]